MKNILFLTLLSLILFNLSLSAQTEPTKNDPMMIGNIKLKDFKKMPYVKWYNEEYKTYKTDTLTLSKVKKPEKKLTIKVFFGSWCSDSRREVPRFIKIAEQLGIKKKKIEFIGLDRKKTAPIYAENIFNIEFVPTFIVFRDGKEIGRIIETPIESLEKDLVKIISNK